jgi:tyrosinase
MEMKTNDAAAKPPLQQVQQMLREAAGDRPAAYGGLPLWEFSIKQLLEAKLRGVPLIAPEHEMACCAHEAGDGHGEGRGARSGLVKGLRGQSPFDGSQLPRLPWGGPPAGDEDIRFISDWIDNGLPATVKIYDAVAIETVEEVIPGDEIAGDEYEYKAGELKQRMNIDCMSETQIEKLRYAFRELFELNRWPEDSRSYNNLALIHQNHCQHGWERFLPWHRVYIYEFEQALQDRCPGVTLPYWDWTMSQYVPAHPDKGWRIPRALQAYLTTESLHFLETAKPAIPKEQIAKLEDLVHPRPRRFPTLSLLFGEVAQRIGADYTKGEHRNRFIDALLDANALWYPLRYPGEFKGTTINQAINYHYPQKSDIDQILSLRTFRDFGGGSLYNDSFGFLDQNPHNTMHIWTGGMNSLFKDGPAVAGEERNKAVRVAGRKFHKREDMYSQPQFGDMFSNLTASYDPVFWPVHSNVDRLWWEWQQHHPESVPADLDAALTPWNYTIRDTLDMHRFGYEYVKSSCVFPVGVEVPVGRFVSKVIDVPETVRTSFKEAEVRLHRVPQLIRSCFIRVFLNLPDANAATPLDDEHYAGYVAIFGHGECYGGPGHCDIPPLRRREFDLRSRDHNTPRNHRVNVTECVRRLFDAGATTLQLSLVVIGVDYQEDNELLRLDSVSLNFLD